MNILIVQDDWNAARHLASSLRRAGHLVTVASSRADARLIGGRFDVGLFDTLSAESPAIELARELLSSGAIATAFMYSGAFAAQLLDQVAGVVEKTRAPRA
jgi:DNA-binding response OmpR family regulator